MNAIPTRCPSQTMQLPTFLTPGKLLDERYLIINLLSNEGGFGRTYLAKDTKRPGNPVCVVKQLKYHRQADLFDKAKKLFYQEAVRLEQLGEHPHIPRLLAYFEKDNNFYLVQEYIEGKTLEQVLATEPVLSDDRVVNYLSQLLATLKFVHDNGAIHRDIKPANIICQTSDDKLVLIDFGAVKEITNIGNSECTIIGTKGYAPIEQWRGKPTTASDIYAVGIIAIQALTGIKPINENWEPGFEFDSTGEIVWQNRVEVKKRLAEILTKMIRQRQHERYQTAEAVLTDLNKLKPQRQAVKAAGIFGAVGVAAIATIYFVMQPPTTPTFSSFHRVGILDENSTLHPINRSYSDAYLVKGVQGQQVTIELNSEDFDPALSLLGSGGKELARNDDIAPDNFNSRIITTLPETGTYQVIVRTSQSGEKGQYQLKAEID